MSGDVISKQAHNPTASGTRMLLRRLALFLGIPLLLLLAMYLSSQMAVETMLRTFESERASGLASVVDQRTGLSHFYARTAAAKDVESTSIVRSAEMTIQTRGFDTARAELQSVVREHDGHFIESRTYREHARGNILMASVQFPAERFQGVLKRLRNLGRVVSESETGEEKLEEGLDVDARIEIARGNLKRLQELLRLRPAKIGEAIELEKEIASAREQLSRLEREKRQLSRRIEFAKLELTLAEEYIARVQMDFASILRELRNAAVEGANVVVKVVVFALVAFVRYIGVGLLVVALLFWPSRIAWRRMHSDIRATSGD